MAHKCTTCDRWIANHRKYKRCIYCQMGEKPLKKTAPNQPTKANKEIDNG